ncbi:Cation/H+ exchanger [Dichotomocladium elegans]|nr:Cation/H+ exchanger [Dichotomocladium elegans]
MDSDSLVSFIAAILGGFILLYGLCSNTVKEKFYLSEALVATAYGIFLGPLGVGLVQSEDTDIRQEIAREFTRIVIGIQVMIIGISLPKKYLRKQIQSLCMLLMPVMSYMWVASALCVWFVVPNLSFLESLMIASCFTPTDPVLSSSIVRGCFAERYVPKRVRDLIAAESGANDGLGYPFLFLALLLKQMDTKDALIQWSVEVMLYEIFFSVVIGFMVGFGARKALRFAHERKWVDEECYSIYAIALALFLIGGVGLIRSDDLLACFIAGCSFTWDGWYQLGSESSRTIETIDTLLNISIFVYIGTIMPWPAMVQLGITRLVVLAIAVHLFRRLPIVMVLYKFIPALRNWREAMFTAWFGPMGVGPVFYCTVAIANSMTDGEDSYVCQVIEPVVYFIVLSSVIVHGFSVPVYQMIQNMLPRVDHSMHDLERRPVVRIYGKYCYVCLLARLRPFG